MFFFIFLCVSVKRVKRFISIYENIFNSNFKTIICITHKSSLLDRFDEIVVFNNGQIEASGSYKELIGKSEFFRTLSDKQSH